MAPRVGAFLFFFLFLYGAVAVLRDGWAMLRNPEPFIEYDCSRAQSEAVVSLTAACLIQNDGAGDRCYDSVLDNVCRRVP